MIHAILAQNTTAPATTFKDVLDILGWLIVIGAALVASAWYIKNYRPPEGTSIQPDPLRVRKAEEFARREDFERLERENAATHKEIFETIHSERRTAEEAQRARTAGLYAKLDAVRTENKHDLQRQTEIINERINDIGPQMVTLLKNTGAIK